MDLTPREILVRLTEAFTDPVKVILCCPNVEIVNLEVGADGVVVTDSGSASEWFAEANGNDRIGQVAVGNGVTVTPGPRGLRLHVDVTDGADLSEAVAALARTLDQLWHESEAVRLDETDELEWEHEPWSDWHEPLDVDAQAVPSVTALSVADLLHQIRRQSRATPNVIVAPESEVTCWIRLDDDGCAVASDEYTTWESLFEFDGPEALSFWEPFSAAVTLTGATPHLDPDIGRGEVVVDLNGSTTPDAAVSVVRTAITAVREAHRIWGSGPGGNRELS